MSCFNIKETEMSLYMTSILQFPHNQGNERIGRLGCYTAASHVIKQENRELIWRMSRDSGERSFIRVALDFRDKLVAFLGASWLWFSLFHVSDLSYTEKAGNYRI